MNIVPASRELWPKVAFRIHCYFELSLLPDPSSPAKLETLLLLNDWTVYESVSVIWHQLWQSQQSMFKAVGTRRFFLLASEHVGQKKGPRSFSSSAGQEQARHFGMSAMLRTSPHISVHLRTSLVLTPFTRQRHSVCADKRGTASQVT